MSDPEQILNALETALKRIKIADGYRTNAGINPILRGVETPDEASPTDTISLFLPDEDLLRTRSNVHNRDMQGSILIAWFCKPTAEDNVQPLLDARADVLKAAFKYGEVPEIAPLVEDWFFAGSSYSPRRMGGTFAQAVFEGVFKWRESV